MLQVSKSGLGYRGVHDLPQGRPHALVAVELSSYALPLWLGLMKGQYHADSTGMMGMSLLVSVGFQRCFVQGIASTGMK